MEKYCGAKQATDVNIIRRMHIACWVTRLQTHTWNMKIHIAFQLQQWLSEQTSLLRYTFTTSPL